MIIEKNKYIDAVYIKTAHGTLKIYENDFSFPGVSIDYALDGYENCDIPICSVEDVFEENQSPETPSNAVVVRVWNDLNSEDYSTRRDIELKDIEKICKEDQENQ